MGLLDEKKDLGGVKVAQGEVVKKGRCQRGRYNLPNGQGKLQGGARESFLEKLVKP